MIFQNAVIPSLSNRTFYNDANVTYLVFMFFISDYPMCLLSIWNIVQLGTAFLFNFN